MLGKVLVGALSPNAVNPKTLVKPYDNILLGYREGLDTNELIIKYGFTPVNAPLKAAELIDDHGDVEWIQLLERAAILADAGGRLQKLSRAMERGEDVDVGRIIAILSTLNDDRMDFVEMDKIEPERNIWQETFYPPIDEHVGGLPKGGLVVVGAPPGIGKCLGKGTRVVMGDGSLKMVEDVRAGDTLLGPDSLPRRVLSVSSGREQMYWVHQNKGIDYRVNESHILSLKKSRTDERQHHGDVVNISVKDWLNWTTYQRNNHKGYKVAVDFPEQNLPLPPYVLGCWLGDGSADAAILTIGAQDEDIISRIKALGMPVTKHTHPNRTASFTLSDGKRRGRGQLPGDTVQGILRSLGLLGNKHIPKIFLCASRKDRMELLAGLIDTDGCFQSSSGMYEITQVRETLIQDIKFLADSLGLRTTLHDRWAMAQTGEARKVFRLMIGGDLSECPIQLHRKKGHPYSRVDWTMTGITIEADKIDWYYGFTLDGDGLFLLEDMTVTHNTTLLLRLMTLAARDGKKVGFFSMEMTLGQIAMRLLEVDKKLPKKAKANIIASEDVCGIGEVYAKASRLAANNPDLYMIGIDFADLMVEGEQSEQVMGEIYKTLAVLAKRTGVTVVLLSQLSRRYEGGLPRVSHLRYSGMAEATASLILLLYNPDQLWVDQGAMKDSNPLPYMEDKAYIIVGKSRYGFREGQVGAFRVDWDDGLGWGMKSDGWFRLLGGG